MKNRLFLTFLLCLALVLSAQAYSPEYDENGRLSLLKADLNRDGYFNIVDIGLVASAWLDERCGLNNPCNGADVFGDGSIDFRDLSLSAAPYGLCTDPTNPDCIHVPLTLFEPPTNTCIHDTWHSIFNTWLPEHQPAWDLLWDDDLDLPEMDWSSDSYGRNGGVSSSPQVAVTTMEHVEDSEGGWSYYDGYGYVTYGKQGVRPLVPFLPVSGLPKSFDYIDKNGETHHVNIDTSNGGYVRPGNGLLQSFNYVDRRGETHHVDLSYDSGGYGIHVAESANFYGIWEGFWPVDLTTGSSGDIFDNIENFEMAGDLLLTSEPDDSGLLGTSNSPFVPSLPGGGGSESGNSWGEVDYLDMNGDGFPDLIPEKGPASKLHLFSGEFTETVVDLHIPSRGPDFVLGRTYRSRVGPNTVIGNGWDHSYNIYLEQYGANLILYNGSGRRDIFYPQPNGTWTSEGFFRELAQEDDESFTMTFPHKGTWTFLAFSDNNAPGKRSAITDRNGNSLTFDYDSSGRLITVHDTLDTPENSREIAIAYNPSGHIESVTDWTGRQVKYQYYSIGDPDGSVGDLKSVTTPAIEDTPTGNDFPEGKTTTYTYSKGFADDRLNHNLLTITDAKGQTYLRNIYGNDPAELSSDHVIQQTRGDSNAVIHFTYIREEPDPSNNYAVTRVIVNDWGNVTEHSYDNLNRLVILRQYTGRAEPNSPTSIDPNVNIPMEKLRPDDPAYFETRFEYNKDSLLTRITYPNDNHVKKVYESDVNPGASARSRGNLREIHYFAGSLEPVSDQNEITRLFVYDANINNNTNQVTCYVDARGNETKYEYDSRGNLTRSEYVRSAESNIIYEWQYNENGQLTASIGADNGSGHRRRDEYTYYTEEDPYQNGYLKNIVVDANNLALTTAYEYDDMGNVTRMTDPRGHDTQFIVNQLNQVVQIIEPGEIPDDPPYWMQEIHYDENNYITYFHVENRNEHGELQPNTHFTTAFEYDILNYLTRTTAEVDPLNSIITEYEYDNNRNLSLVRFGEATNGNQPHNVIRYLYDERGLVFQTVRAESDPNQSSTQYDYDDNGNLKTVRQGLEATPYVSSFQYDGFNRLVEANNPMGNISVYHYDAGGNLISKRFEGELVDMPNGEDNVRLYESSYEYDTLNRPIYAKVSHFDPNTQSPIGDGNSVTQIFYSDNSQVTQVVDDRGNETLYQYDTANRLTAVTDAKGNEVFYSYDENSNVISIMELEISDLGSADETFVTSYVYDNLDRLVKVIDNADNATEVAYDSRGNLTVYTDALGHQSRYTYDGLNRLISTVRDLDGDGPDGDGSDVTTNREWDDSSQLVGKTDDNGNTTTYQYDALNRLVKTIFADGTEFRLVYDIHHNVIRTTDAAGSIVDNTFDLLGRLTAKTIAPGLGVSTDTTFENYKYDGLSRLIFAQDNDSNLTLSYDSLSNVTSETLNGKTTKSTYDGMGNKLSCTYPGGRVVTCTYDELNRKSAVRDDYPTVSYDYIGPGRVERKSLGNNTRCDYAYDNLKRIVGTTHSDSASGLNFDQRTYGWNEIYNKVQRNDVRFGGPQLTHDYTYDSISRLINTIVTDNSIRPPAIVRDTDYALDGVGNRTTVTGSPDPGNYTMDETTPEPADFQMNQYTTTPFDSRSYDKNGNLVTIDEDQRTQKDIRYDYRNQMVEFTETSTGQVHIYSYDILGRRTERIVDSTGSAQTTRYLYDGFQVIEEQDVLGTSEATYVYGNYTHEVLNMQNGSVGYYYHTDDLFNVMAITDVTGAVAERYEYQDYGEPSFFDSSGGAIAGSVIGNPYLFTGRRYDLETGWYNYRTRYLDPKAGRFTRSR